MLLPRGGGGKSGGSKTTTTTNTICSHRKRRRKESFETRDDDDDDDGKIIIGPRRQKWRSLEAGKDDLSLDRTLPTGQSFRWQKVRNNNDDEEEEETEKNDINNNNNNDINNNKTGWQYSTYVGVIGRRVVKIRERIDAFEEEEEEENRGGNTGPKKSTIEFRILNEEVDDETSAENATKDMRAYFNLDDPIPLKDLFEQFSKADPRRFGALRKYVRGARTLRQPPAECLISFVCSSNNNIARIKKMVESLCEKYGEELVCNASSDYDGANDDEKEESKDNKKIYYAFPTVEQLAAKCDEQTLRDLGFGYRAKFIPAIAKELVKRGGESYLLKLRDAPQTEEEKDRAISELTSLPGVGPKVAGCAALFSLDKKSVVPVDTHVWQLAREHFDPNGELASMETPASSSKSSTKKGTKAEEEEEEESTPTTPSKEKPLSITPKMMKRCEHILASIYGDYAGYAHTALFVAELPSVREGLPERLRTPTKAQQRKSEKKKNAHR